MFHGGGVAVRPPAAVTASCRVAPTTAGNLSQHRIVWPRPRITRNDRCCPGTQQSSVLYYGGCYELACSVRSPVCRRRHCRHILRGCLERERFVAPARATLLPNTRRVCRLPSCPGHFWRRASPE